MNGNYLEDLSVMFEIALSMGETLDAEREYLRFSELLIHRMGYDYVGLWLKEEGIFRLKHGNPSTKVDRSTVAEKDELIGHLKELRFLKVDFGDEGFSEIVLERDISSGSCGFFYMTEPEGFVTVYNRNGLSEREIRQTRTLVEKFQKVVGACSYHEKALEEIELRKSAEQALLKANIELEKLLLENEIMLNRIRNLNKELEDKVKERTRELEETIAKLEELAIIDCMTGLYNRRHVLILGEEVFLNSKMMTTDFSAIMLDIDDFKRVNDTYGHAVGDRVIEIMGKRLANTVKATDLVGRYGGEEFIIFLSCNKAAAIKVAERIRRNVANKAFLIGPDMALPITVSLGVAARQSEESFDDLLTRADDMMYQAKRTGRNRIAS